MAIVLIGMVLLTRKADEPLPEVPNSTTVQPATKSLSSQPATREKEAQPSSVHRHTASVAPSSPEPKDERTLFQRLLDGESISLSDAQKEKFLTENNRSADSLLALGDIDSLREAAQNSPNDPLVQMKLAFKGETEKERLDALNAFKELSKTNPLGDYLSALRNFKNGDTDMGVKDLNQAMTKPDFQDFYFDQAQVAEELYLSTGHKPTDAKASGMFGVELPHFVELRDLGLEIKKLQQGYMADGDTESATAMQEMALIMARQLQDNPHTLLHEMVGLALERNAWADIPGDTIIGEDGQTVAERIEALNNEGQSLKELANISDLLTNLPEHDLLIYLDRSKTLGEAEALKWLEEKYSGK